MVTVEERPSPANFPVYSERGSGGVGHFCWPAWVSCPGFCSSSLQYLADSKLLKTLVAAEDLDCYGDPRTTAGHQRKQRVLSTLQHPVLCKQPFQKCSFPKSNGFFGSVPVKPGHKGAIFPRKFCWNEH